MAPVRRLLVVSHVSHYRDQASIYAYGPYVREMNAWCDLFPEVVIAAPCRRGRGAGDALAFSRENVRMFPIPPSGGETVRAKIVQMFLLPWIVLRLCIAMAKADAIHVRCPGNLGLLGVVLGPLFSKLLIAKYAGQWSGYSEEARSVRLQRWLLASRWWRGIVTVYGRWPNQPDHVVPFFTSVMTREQVVRAKKIASMDKPLEPLSIVFVGRLSKAKNVDQLIEAVALLAKQGIDLRCRIVGQGAEEESLHQLATRHGLDDRIEFAGGVEYDRVFDFHEQAHVLVLASETEGWPKAIAEAMACGLVCIGTNRGLVPWMLSEGRGFTVEPGDAGGLSEILRQLAIDVEERHRVSRRAAEFGQRYSLDSLREALAALMSDRWGVTIGSNQGGETNAEPESVPSNANDVSTPTRAVAP